MSSGIEQAVFWLLAALTIVAALLVVHTASMFRAALLLVVSFLGVAGIFALVNAEFLAVVQVLIYGGGISVLVIFAVMATRDLDHGNRHTQYQPTALFAGSSLLGLLIYAIVQAEWALLPETLPSPLADVFVDTPAHLGQMLLGEFVLAFEIAGVLLLAVVVGALSLVRDRTDA
jgi:NADH-quinone oxidoreductase subunit J